MVLTTGLLFVTLFAQVEIQKIKRSLVESRRSKDKSTAPQTALKHLRVDGR